MVLNIEPHIQLNNIYILEPRYHDNVALIATKRVKEHNRIIFTKAKSLIGKEFYISSEKIKRYPKTSNGVIPCYEVPIGELTLMEQRKEIW